MTFKVVCIVGSMRFYKGMLEVAEDLTTNGCIVLMPFVHVAREEQKTSAVKQMLDAMHRVKIDMSDAIVIVTDKAEYIGESTTREIAYARNSDKQVLLTHVEND